MHYYYLIQILFFKVQALVMEVGHTMEQLVQ